jgi:hypothetical protein
MKTTGIMMMVAVATIEDMTTEDTKNKQHSGR